VSYDLGTAHGKIVLSYDSNRDVDRAEKDIDKLERKAKTSDVSFKKLGTTLKGFGKGVSMAGITVGLINAAASAAALGIQILGIIPNLVSILSLSSALPGAFVGILASVGVLKAAFAGMGAVLKSAFDPAKAAAFDKALKTLSPSAQTFAKALKASAPALKDFQKGIQESFFSSANLATQIPRVLRALGTLRPDLNGLAKDFGEVTRQVANFILSSDSIDFVQAAISRFRSALADVTPSIVPILAGLRAVGTVGLPLLTNLSSAVGIVAIKFADWLNAVASDGRLQTWIATALETLQTLGQIISNVFSIFNSVVSAANATGGGLLNTLALITGQFADFLSSVAGGDAMRALFASILDVAKQLSPVITTLVLALAQALAPAIATIAKDLGPILLQTVQALAPAFAPLANGIAALLVAVAPLLPPLAQLVALLAGQLANAVLAIVGELGPLVSLLAQGLAKALTGITPLFAIFNKNLPLTAELGAALASSFAKLMPTLLELGNAIMQSLVPVLPQLTDAAASLLPIMVKLGEAIANNLNAGLQVIIPLIPTLVKGFVLMVQTIAAVEGAILGIITFFFNFGTAIFNVIHAVQTFVSAVPSAFAAAFAAIGNAISSFIGGVIAFFTALPGRIGAVLAAIPGVLLNAFKLMILEGVTEIGFGLGLIVGLFTKFPGDAARAIASLASFVGAKVREAWNAAFSATVNGIAAAVSFAHSLPGRTVSAIASLAGLISAAARNAWNGLVSRFNSGISSAAAAAGRLPGRIRGALGNLGGILLGAGKAIIQGLINGISSGISRVLGMVSSLASRVKSAFNSALSIFSPSKVFFESGVNIDEGLINGMKAKLQQVMKMGQTLAGSVIRPTARLANSVGPTIVDAVNASPAPRRSDAGDAGAVTFGPYHLEVDGQVIASLAIDAVTGAPVLVSDAADEGARQKAWAGSGRRGRSGS
jgi:phage-related protein